MTYPNCVLTTGQGIAFGLLSVSDKNSQQRDIERARRVATDWR